MKTVFKIAKTELALLFYSPIAWFLLVAFLFQSALSYTGRLEGLLTTQDMGGYGLRFLKFLTSRTFAPPYGMWMDIVHNLYLYLPLLTMGLMSREISSGTIKLLYSSPTKIKEIIFGKFLAMMLYNLLLIAVLLLIAIAALCNIQAADAGLLFSGLFGIYLLLCTYAAIGLFMSCLTSYQVVAALSTLVLLGVLNYIGALWQGVDIVRDLTYFLSISGRTEHMLRGLITTKDVLYFLIIISIFLSFSIYKLQSDRESKPVWIKIGRYVLIFVCALALGYVTARPGFVGYFDATATKTNTLTDGARKILDEMGDERLEVASYINLLDGHFWSGGKPDQRNEDMERWEPYLRFKPDIQFKYVYFYDSVKNKNLYKYNPGQSLKTMAEKGTKAGKLDLDLFRTPGEIHSVIDLRPEENRYVMQLKYKGRTTFLRLFNDQVIYPTEAETGAAIKRLLQARLPKIAFVQGELERSIDKAGDRHYEMLTNQITFRNSLVNQGFDVEKVNLKQQAIPTDIAALVIADPRVVLDTVSLMKLERYIAAGGNILIAGEPGKQALLDPLLKPLGVQFMEGMLVQKNKDFSPEMTLPFLTSTANSFTKKLMADAEDSFPLSTLGAAALTYDRTGPFTIRPLALTEVKVSWNKKIRPDEETIIAGEDAGMGNEDADMGMEEDMNGRRQADKKINPALKELQYSPEAGDTKGPLPVVLGLTRTFNGKEQRIVVAGDADFLSNSELRRFNIETCNFAFSTGIFSWLSYGEFPIDSSRPPSKDKKLDLSDGGLTFLKVLLLGILPGILLIIGSILLIRRKRK